MIYNIIMKVRAYGKLNLSLYITGRRGRLHTLDSVMTSVTVFDEAEILPSDRTRVRFLNVSVNPERNTALSAAALVEKECGLRLSVTVKKGIPVGGGMGGSSADAAAVLWAAEKLAGADVKKLAPRIGSDVLFMIRGGTARVTGTGDVTESVPSSASFSALVADCGAVGTAACYEAFDRLGGGSGGCGDALVRAPALGSVPEDELINDLAPAAALLNPRIKAAAELMESAGLTPHLTGSGGCLYALGGGEKEEKLLRSHGFGCFAVRCAPAGVEEI